MVQVAGLVDVETRARDGQCVRRNAFERFVSTAFLAAGTKPNVRSMSFSVQGAGVVSTSAQVFTNSAIGQ